MGNITSINPERQQKTELGAWGAPAQKMMPKGGEKRGQYSIG
jgi:hypothetical protein